MSDRYALGEGIVHVDDPISGAVLVLDLGAAMTGAPPLALRGAASAVWRAAVAGERAREIAREVARAEGVDQAVAAVEVDALLGALLSQGCLVAAEGAHAR